MEAGVAGRDRLVRVAGLGVAAAGCSQVNMLKARMALKDAHTAYQQQDYRGAIGKYEEAIAADATQTEAYFYLGNSYDNMYRSARKGDATNDAFMSKAVDYYKKDAEIDPDPKMKKLSLQYLVAAYGPLEVYGFHALEALQAMVERRKGGETGVKAVTCLTGNAVWKAGDAGQWSWELLEAALGRSETLNPGDVISGGSPAGTNLERPDPRWMRAGDTAKCDIEGIGALTNPVVAESTTSTR